MADFLVRALSGFMVLMRNRRSAIRHGYLGKPELSGSTEIK